TGEHPEFREDKNLFVSWRAFAEARELKIRIGRWKIPGNPIAILIDYTGLFMEKDTIFRDLWLQFKVDSLTGQWDYIEPALFGYAAGKVIECFYHHYLTLSDKIVAQFHEWMTGAGLLYVESHVPQIGTVFTTHATVTGRTIAGNGLPLYGKLESYDGDREAKRFNVISKHSLEKTAAHVADCFTTVSEITATECRQLLQKEPDVITPNGFEAAIVPDPLLFRERRAAARKKLLGVAAALTGKELNDDTLLVLKSGRYEFRNKGVDIFIDAMGELNREGNLPKNIVAFIFIPAHHVGPREDLLRRINNENIIPESRTLTHHLQGADSDPVLQRLRLRELDNKPADPISVIFTPVYLDGHDGIFNLSYYELLTGFDISVFPSYYEPWGYTPLESLAFHIPAVTTTLTGFGMLLKESSDGAYVIARNDSNDSFVAEKIASILREYAGKNENEIRSARENAYRLSKKALWKNLIVYYKKAYSIALQKTHEREEKFTHPPHVQEWDTCPAPSQLPPAAKPMWRKVFVKSEFPSSLLPLQELAGNLWWTWNSNAEELFSSVDPLLWETCGQNPVEMLNNLSHKVISQLSEDESFLRRLAAVTNDFRAYMKAAPGGPRIAYFCMEYGLHNSLKLYSGGLGILAGDYLKQASDSCADITGIGLLYRNGYFRQKIAASGEQVVTDDHQKFTALPLHPVINAEGDWLTINIAFPARTLYARAWRIDVGRTKLYLLDTDIHENIEEDRQITSHLYGGDHENRLRQEIVLGIGGVRLLYILGIKPDIFHYNEGHSAFAGIERLYHLVLDEKLSFGESVEVVKASSLFTTHTPIAAGHDTFSEEMLRAYFSHYAQAFNISWNDLLNLGKTGRNSQELFSMSYLASKLAGGINGVSAVHEQVTRKMFNVLWPAYLPEELHIGHVTNGIHLSTWMAPEWKKLCGEDALTDDHVAASTLSGLPPARIWETHLQLKQQLISAINSKYGNAITGEKKDRSLPGSEVLLIGFARRFVPYKRSDLLFRDLDKLSRILNREGEPVAILFSGKAHPDDVAGQTLLKKVKEISVLPQFEGKILFLENYDMAAARMLVSGVDVWLNTPVAGMEASGTSGMKAGINGVLNLSVCDGWWAEAFDGELGWCIGNGNSGVADSDENDAASLYNLLDGEIIPLFFRRNAQNIPVSWVERMKKSFAHIIPAYSMQRALQQYGSAYYAPLLTRFRFLGSNEFENAAKLAAWKELIRKSWNTIEVQSVKVHNATQKPFPVGEKMEMEVILSGGTVPPGNIGVEIVFTDAKQGNRRIVMKRELDPSEPVPGKLCYSAAVAMENPGVYQYSFRLFPKNTLWQEPELSVFARWI
ncbi:MAG TPA: alpha-glucan family phosphorylase, partial [Bacteroidia bacterium]|nr:alpha-glucan family phosphorylase [Bacteroidia bacterium]